jgi:hypothetical protein
MERAVGSAVAVVLWLLASAAAARPIVYQGCFNDTDCGGPECGGAVCDWTQPVPNPVDPEKPYTCVPAGTGPKGQEGWCTSTNGDANCKCRDLGAKCVGVYCTFTRPQDAPTAGGTASVAGTTSVGGGSSVGGAPSKAGSGPTAGRDSGGAFGGTMGHEDTQSSGSSARTSRACSVSIVGRNAGERYLGALAGLAAALATYCRKRARIPR